MGNYAKCKDAASDLPGGLTVESFVDPQSCGCLVSRDGQASHVVRIRNRTLLRFELSISSECETQHIRYGNGTDRWDEDLSIGHRPVAGGPRERIANATLMSGGAASDESLKIIVKYKALGCMCEGSSAMQLQVDTED
jgi:hypothetical protein